MEQHHPKTPKDITPGGIELGARKGSEYFSALKEAAYKIKKPASLDFATGIAKTLLFVYAVVFPLFFLPTTASPVSLNKEYFSVFVLFAVFVLWAFSAIAKGKIVIRKSFLNFSVFLLAVAAGASVFFSQSRWVSVFGFSGQTDTFVAFALYVLAFFLVGQYFGSASELRKILYGLGGTFVLSAAFFILQGMGIFLLPFEATRSTVFNTIGTVNAASLFFALGAFWGLVFWVNAKSGFERIFSFAVFFAGFLSVISVSFNFAFIALIVALVMFLSLQIFGRGIVSVQKLVLPTVVLVLSAVLVLGVFSVPALSFRAISGTQIVEVAPTIGASADVVSATFKEGPIKALFGSGPATFVYQWLKARPIGMNDTDFWNVRFRQGHSGFLTQTLNLGMFGLLALFVLVFSVVLVALGAFFLVRKKVLTADEENLFAGAMCSVFFLLLCWFVYPFVFTLNMLLFIFLAATVVYYGEAKKKKLFLQLGLDGRWGGGASQEDAAHVQKTTHRTIDFTTVPQKTLVYTLGLVVLITFSVIFIYIEGQRYAAALYFAETEESVAAGDIDRALVYAASAAQYDAHNDLYWRSLSQVNLMKINLLFAAESVSQQELLNVFGIAREEASSAANKAIAANGIDPFNWAMKGVVFESAMALVDNAEEAGMFAAQAYKEARVRDPFSPLRALDEGRAHLLSADQLARKIAMLRGQQGANPNVVAEMQRAEQEYLKKSLEILNEAVRLKSDYAPAHFLIAQVYDRQGDMKSAIAKTEQLRYAQAGDVGLIFQLGFLYYKDGQLDKAQREFEIAVTASPNYSNARYFLGLVFDEKGMKEEAVDQFTRIAQLNPLNTEVQQILENLKGGKRALAGFTGNAAVPSAPIQERSTEGNSTSETQISPTQNTWNVQEKLEGSSLQLR